MSLPLIYSLLMSNQRHQDRSLQAILTMPANRIGVFGLAFKENTDDLRESPVISAIEQLVGKGREVRIFDPHIQLANIYGANRSYLLHSLPHIGRLLANDLDELIEWSDCLVLAQQASTDAHRRIAASGKPTLDLVRRQKMRAMRATGAENASVK